MAGPSVELLRKVPLFSDLEQRDLQRIAQSFKERVFRAGETVTDEGKGAVGFFVIEDGTASVSVRGQERGRLGPGDYFGEIALVDQGARTATITADTDVRCWGMTFWEFRPLVEENSGIAWKLLQSVTKRLRAAEQREV